jgi:magnesium transporter
VVIADRASYRDGRRVPAPDDLSDALAEARRDGGFVWMGLVEPTEAELNWATRELGVHPLAVEDAVHAHQRAKLDIYDGSLFAVFKTLRGVGTPATVEVGEISLFVGDGYVVSVRHGAALPLSAVRRRLEGQPRLLVCGPAAVLYAVMDAVVDGYVELADGFDAEASEVEGRVFAPGRGDYAGTIYRLKRQVGTMLRAADPLLDPARSLAETEVPFVAETMRPFFRDVYDHALRFVDSSRDANAMLSDILSANVSRVSLQQNDDMRRISAWAAMAAVPTMIAGIYGMNFHWMPELSWHYGYFGVLGVMAAICAGLYVAFRRSGWL